MTQEATIAVGQPWPEQIPVSSDGTAHHQAEIRSLLPLRILAVADVSPQHEQAMIDAAYERTTDLFSPQHEQAMIDAAYERTTDLFSLQPHLRILGCQDWQGQTAFLPVLMVGHHLRGPDGPIHRPLHWVATPTLECLQAMPHLDVQECLQMAEGTGEVYVEGGLVVLGRNCRVLSIQDIYLTPCASMNWVYGLRAAAKADGHHLVDDESWEQAARDAAGDLLPLAERQNCIRPLEHVAMLDLWGCEVRGGQAQGYLIETGWLHPKQIGGEA